MVRKVVWDNSILIKYFPGTKSKDPLQSPRSFLNAFQRLTKDELTRRSTSTITTQTECKLLDYQRRINNKSFVLATTWSESFLVDSRWPEKVAKEDSLWSTKLSRWLMTHLWWFLTQITRTMLSFGLAVTLDHLDTLKVPGWVGNFEI